jgi:hypothetical protein
MDQVAALEAGWNDAPQMIVDPPLSFEEFFHLERDRLFRLMFVITKNRQEAEDLSQDAFARVWERWDHVGAMENPTGYLHRTAMNLFRSRYRRALMAARRGIGIAAQEDAYEAVDDRQVALQALSSLAPRAGGDRPHRGASVHGGGSWQHAGHPSGDRPRAPFPGALCAQELRKDD